MVHMSRRYNKELALESGSPLVSLPALTTPDVSKETHLRAGFSNKICVSLAMICAGLRSLYIKK